MPATDIVDYRRSSTHDLLDAIAAGEPLALAEAYHRTSNAAFACATRLLGERDAVEAALRDVYGTLWAEPPGDVPLEGWVRHRVFVEGRSVLQEQGRGPSSPSTALLLRDAAIPDSQGDHTEQLIAGLDNDALRALLLAHDRGIPTADQRSPEAEAGLRRALLTLAEVDDPGGCPVEGLADHVLGLLGDAAAERVRAAASAQPGCAEVARALRRGRRRVEGLPPTPDIGYRVIAAVLTATRMAPAAGAGDRARAPEGPDADGARDGDTPPTALEGAAAEPAPEAPPAAPSVLDEPAAGLPGEPRPDAAAAPVAPEASAPSSPDRGTDEERDTVRFEQLGESDDADRGRRVLTVALTAVGALLLLAAGAVAGLLLIRIFLG